MAENRLFLGVENSATGRAWRDRLDERGAARALTIAQRHDLPELLARILAGRNIEADAVDAFLDPTIKHLMPDPLVLTAMKAAAERIADAVTRGESVAIFGDYDVDGATSSAVLARYLRQCGIDPLIHIPDRLFEGYGPNVEAVRSLAERGATLLVCVDCGTTSIEPLQEAKKLGVDVVVIDHHQADEVLPPAVAIVNPNRRDDLSGLGHLAAVGLVFMTVVALNRELRQRGFWTGGAARARSAGVSRRCRARHRRRRGAADRSQPRLRRQGIDRAAPARASGACQPDGRGAAFRSAGSLASRLSARPAHQCRRPHRPRRYRRQASDRRTIRSKRRRMAAELDRLNRERQAIEQETLAQAEAEALAALGIEEKGAVVVTAAEGWHPGIVGLVAARLKEKFGRPAFAIALEPGGIGTGSGRSIPGVDIGRAVRRAVAEGLLVKGGGHAMAAGVTLRKGALAQLRAFLETALGADVEVSRRASGLLDRWRGDARHRSIPIWSA